MRKLVLLFVLLFSFLNIIAQDCNLNEEARRHVARAKGYMAAAEKPEDYLDVYNEYKVAYDNAPNCPDICYNLAHAAEILCKINTQNCDVAIAWYNKYLEINPNAPDRNEVKDKTYEVGAMKEMYQKQLNQEKEKDWEKWCGVWYTYYPKDDKITNHTLEIFIFQGRLMATIDDETVPVILKNDNIIIKYTYKSTLYFWEMEYNLHLISMDKMGGQISRKGYNENFDKPYCPPDISSPFFYYIKQ